MKNAIAETFASKVKYNNQEPAIIFVHGLGGSPQSTWSKMVGCFAKDEDFRHFTIDYYKYPTKLIRLPFTPPLPGLRSIAAGLTTFLDENYGRRSSLILVAHSLGGLIARQMIVSEMRAGRPCRIDKLALIATPHTGSMLASVGNLVSFPNQQLKRLAQDDEALRSLNADWEQLKVEEHTAVRYIIGGCDRAVPQASAVPYVDKSLKQALIIDANHRSIIAPDDLSDIRYKTVRRFILEETAPLGPIEGIQDHRGRPRRRADPLFDAYTPDDAPYYIERAIDQVVRESLGNGNVWLLGASGVGKTASLRRAVYQSGWELNHVNLGGYQVHTATELFRAMTREVATIAEFEKLLSTDSDVGQCCTYLKSVLQSFSEDRTIATVVEELPLPPNELIIFIEQVRILLESIAIDQALHGRAVFAFSSLKNPGSLSSRVHERMQFLNLGDWSNLEITQLIELLSITLRPILTEKDKVDIALAAKGSPRFVKRLFRSWRNGTDDKAPLATLLNKLRLEEF